MKNKAKTVLVCHQNKQDFQTSFTVIPLPSLQSNCNLHVQTVEEKHQIPHRLYYRSGIQEYNLNHNQIWYIKSVLHSKQHS